MLYSRKQFLNLLDPDANPTSGSGASSPPQDANQGVADTTQGQQPTASSAEGKDANKDFAELAIAAMTKKDESSSSDKGPDKGQESTAPQPGEVRNANNTPDLEAQKGDEKKDEKKSDPDDYSDLPFHQHERFKEVVQQRKELKESLAKAEPHIQQAKVIQQFMTDNGITPEQFKNVMEIQALLNSNPLEAKKRLQPVLEYLSKFEGIALPADLQQEVDSGTLSLERARQIVSLQTQKSFVEERSQQSQVQQRNNALFNTLNMWETQMQRNDPDYTRKQQMVVDRFVALSASQPWQTPDQIVALANKAYQDVNQWISGWVPKPKTTRNLSSNGASTAVDDEPKSWDQVEAHMVKKFATGRR